MPEAPEDLFAPDYDHLFEASTASPPKQVVAAEGRRKKKRTTPGVLSQLSLSCRRAARQLASGNLFQAVYDNINLTIRVAEQIVGRNSELVELTALEAVLTSL